MPDPASNPNPALHLRVEAWSARRKRDVAKIGVLLLIALPATGLVMHAVDHVQNAGDMAT